MTNELTDLTNIPAPTLTLDPVSDGEVAEASIIEVDIRESLQAMPKIKLL